MNKYSPSVDPLGSSQLLEFLVGNNAFRLEHLRNDSLEFCEFGKKTKFDVLKEPYMIMKIDGHCGTFHSSPKESLTSSLINCDIISDMEKTEKPEEFQIFKTVLQKALHLKTYQPSPFI